MAIKQRRLNMAMSDFRNEFLGTSGEVKMSDLVRESVNSAGGGGTRNAGNTGSFAGRLSNNKLSASAVGVYIGNSSVPAAGTAPTYAATNPKTSTSNMAFSDYNGVSGSFPSSKWSLNAASGEMFGNSGSQTAAYISRNIDYSPTVKNSGYSFNNGFAQQAGYKAMNTTSYLHEDLCSVARPGDVMFAIFCSNSGANFTSAAFYPSNGTTGTFNYSAAQCSSNWMGQSNNAYEFSDGNDRVTYAVAKRCTGGETHASFFMYSSAANSSVYFGYYVGIIRCRGVGSGTNTTISNLGIGTNTDFYVQMGASYGYGEACIIGDLSGYSTNNPAVSTNSASDHMMRSELSQNLYEYGPLSAAAGMYEESVQVLKGLPTTTRYLYCRTGTSDNLNFSLKVNTWN